MSKVLCKAEEKWLNILEVKSFPFTYLAILLLSWRILVKSFKL